MNPNKFRTLVVTAGLLFFGWPESFYPQNPELTRAQLWRERREQKRQNLSAYQPGGLERGLLYVQSERVLQKLAQGWKGFHPKLGGLSTGSGFAGGIRYAPKFLDGNLSFETSGAASGKLYQWYDLKLGAPRLLSGKLFVEFYSRYRSYPQEDFFGLGPDSIRSNRSDFALEDSVYDVSAGVRWVPWLATGFRAGYLKTNIGRGRDERFPDTVDLFSSTLLPELNRQSNFYHADAFLALDTRDEPGNPRSGGYFGLTYSYYDDQTLGLHSFRRLDIDLQQYVPFLKQKRVVALRALASLSDTSPGQTVPFYMMYSLGGSETLRGYREFRFRDRNLLLFNVEYRWEAFSGLDMALFADAGKVASRRSDINFTDLESDVGFGFRFNTFRSVFLRLDVAFSHEGTRFFVKFGPAF